jgi:hypothetical protein
MPANRDTNKPFTFRFINASPKVLLELTNTTDQIVKAIEILTIFLKDEATLGRGPSQAHIRFNAVGSMQPNEKTVLSHKTWIDGKPADAERDQMERLEIVAGKVSPYVLDISWENLEGKARFQRIPVGH